MKLAEAANEEIRQHGMVGLDFNMAVICICAKRTCDKVHFKSGGALDYNGKVDYWARKRDFGEVHFDSEDAIIKRAFEKFGISEA